MMLSHEGQTHDTCAVHVQDYYPEFDIRRGDTLIVTGDVVPRPGDLVVSAEGMVRRHDERREAAGFEGSNGIPERCTPLPPLAVVLEQLRSCGTLGDSDVPLILRRVLRQRLEVA